MCPKGTTLLLYFIVSDNTLRSFHCLLLMTKHSSTGFSTKTAVTVKCLLIIIPSDSCYVEGGRSDTRHDNVNRGGSFRQSCFTDSRAPDVPKLHPTSRPAWIDIRISYTRAESVTGIDKDDRIMTGWLLDWLTDWLTDCWLYYKKLINWLGCWLAYWLDSRNTFNRWLISWVATEWLTGLTVGLLIWRMPLCVTKCLTDLMSGWMTDGLTDSMSEHTAEVG